MSPAREVEAPSTLSLAVAAISGGLIVLLVGYLGVQTVRDDAPPAIDVEVAQPEARVSGGEGYVPVDVRNSGDRPAAEVEIEIRFGADHADGVTERTRVDFLSGGESRRVWVIGPPGADVTARVVGYQEP